MSWLHTFVELFIPADLSEIDGTATVTLPHPLTAAVVGTLIVLNQIDGSAAATLPHPDTLSATGTLSVGGYDRDYTTGSYVGIAAPSCARTASGYAAALDGALTSFSANTLRRTNRGLLSEPSRTNLAIRSATLGTNWTATNITVGDNEYTAPDGTNTMESLQDSASNAQHSVSENAAVVSGSTYAWSVYVDPTEDARAQITLSNTGFPTAHANFNLTNIVPSSVSGIDNRLDVGMDAYPDGYRISMRATANATGTSAVILGRLATDTAGRLASYAGSSTKIGAWGAQLEAGQAPTSPIITAGTTATRDGDVNTTAFNGIAAGAIVIEAQAPAYNGTHVLWDWRNSDDTNHLLIYRDTTGHMRFVATSSGVEIVNLDTGYVCPFGTFRIFAGWADNNWAASLNGNATVTSTSGLVPTGLTTIQVGGDSTGHQWEGWIKRETLYYARIDNDAGKLAARYPTLNTPRPQIFLDTDFDSDIDDVVDLLLLLALERAGECDIIGICVSSANTSAVGALYAVLNFYGRTAIPVGANTTSLGNSSSLFVSETVAAYGVPGKTTASNFPTGLTVYRQSHADAADNSVSIVVTGAASSLNDFLNSVSDGISALNGSDLITSKVREAVLVMGYWPAGPAVSDMFTSRGFANNLFTNFPRPIIMGDINLAEVQIVKTGGRGAMMNLASNDPARFAWVTFWNHFAEPPTSPSVATRTGWSQVSFLALVRGLQDYMRFGGENGRPYVASNGLTTFFQSPGCNGAYYEWMPSVSGQDVEDTINALIGTGGLDAEPSTSQTARFATAGVELPDAVGTLATTAMRVRNSIRILADVPSLQFQFPSFYVDDLGFERGLGYSSNRPTLVAHIDYPGNSVKAITFSAATSLVLTDNTAPLSDAISASLFGLSQFAAGTQIFVYWELRFASVGGKVPISTNAVSGVTGEGWYDGGTTQYLSAGAISAGGGTAGAFDTRLLAVVGRHDDDAFIIYGDSNAHGYITETTYDVGDGSDGGGWFARAMYDAGIPYAKAGKNHGRVAYMLADNYATIRLALALYATHAIVAFGTNDLSAAGDANQFLVNSTTFRNLLKQVNQDLFVAQMKVIIRTTSSDSWRLAANQTVVSGFAGATSSRATVAAALASGGSSLDLTFDIAPYIWDSSNHDKWKADGSTAFYETPDGIHMSLLGHNDAAVGFAADILPLFPAAAPMSVSGVGGGRGSGFIVNVGSLMGR